MIGKNVFIHPKALVEEGAEIGHNTRIWANVHVLSGAKIGNDCNICDFSFIENGVQIGSSVTVKNGVQLYEGMTIEDGVFIGPNAVFTNDMFPRAFRKLPKQEWLKPTLLKQGCTIGANTTILCGQTIGRYSFIGAGALVTKNVPDFGLVLGVPARFHSWICQCATKLVFGKNQKQTTCLRCKWIYKLSKDKRSLIQTPLRQLLR